MRSLWFAKKWTNYHILVLCLILEILIRQYKNTDELRHKIYDFYFSQNHQTTFFSHCNFLCSLIYSTFANTFYSHHLMTSLMWKNVKARINIIHFAVKNHVLDMSPNTAHCQFNAFEELNWNSTLYEKEFYTSLSSISSVFGPWPLQDQKLVVC